MTGNSKEHASPAEMEKVEAQPIVEENKKTREEQSKGDRSKKHEDAEK